MWFDQIRAHELVVLQLISRLCLHSLQAHTKTGSSKELIPIPVRMVGLPQNHARQAIRQLFSHGAIMPSRPPVG